MSFLKNTAKQGIFLGIGFCLYTVFMWLTKLDTDYLSIGQYLDIAISFLPLFAIIWAIWQENKDYGISIPQRFGIAIWVSFIAYWIYTPFLYVYHHFINPNWFSFVLKLKCRESFGRRNYETTGKNDRSQRRIRHSVLSSGVYSFCRRIADNFYANFVYFCLAEKAGCLKRKSDERMSEKSLNSLKAINLIAEC